MRLHEVLATMKGPEDFSGLGLQEAIKQRNAAIEKAEAIVATCEKENRAMSQSDTQSFDAAMGKAKQLGEQIAKINSQNTLHATHEGIISRKRTDMVNHSGFRFPGLAEYLKTREGGISASLSEGSDLQYILPAYEVAEFRTAYPQIDPFRQAGAQIDELSGIWTAVKYPWVIAGEDPTVYSEGTGPSSDQSAGVVTVQVDSPKKHAFLSLPTEEAMADIPTLASVLGAEGIRRCYNKVSKSVTAALVSQLNSASATMTPTGDNLENLLNLISAVPQVFASTSNCFMMSRRTLALTRNTRVGADNLPAFDPVSQTILGYSVVLNDSLAAGVALFGDFRSAVYIRRTQLAFQILNEAYRTSGKIGLRFSVRADWAFFAEAANAGTAEQPVYMLTDDFGS